MKMNKKCVEQVPRYTRRYHFRNFTASQYFISGKRVRNDIEIRRLHIVGKHDCALPQSVQVPQQDRATSNVVMGAHAPFETSSLCYPNQGRSASYRAFGAS
ncbi:hypothetical protein HR51_30840 [Burkholderia cepacia]|nr:hypothetical protein HR51_30840 [Burkholderia cepacia]